MAYRKRSLDLPLPGDSQSTPKHPRGIVDAGEMHSKISGIRPAGSGPPVLPSIRSLNEFAFSTTSVPPIPASAAIASGDTAFGNSATTIPSLRHLHNTADYHRAMPPPSAIPLQQPRQQSALVPTDHPMANRSPPPPSPMHVVRTSNNSPEGSDAALGDTRLSPHTSSLETDYSLSAAAAATVSGTSADAIKVARNWSRDETLSLVRAIGRHYESLKRCKTNQERSNVWHRIHKEHSAQFPGRSKKASQDRWGKVLSDYKDVMVHNKEKGAARWTFDFFKEVANIVEGDSQFMEVSSPSTLSPPSVFIPSRSSVANIDSSVGYPVAGADFSPVASTPSVGRPPFAYHRMSEPNLCLAGVSQQQQQQQQHYSQQHQQQSPQSQTQSQLQSQSQSQSQSQPQPQPQSQQQQAAQQQSGHQSSNRPLATPPVYNTVGQGRRRSPSGNAEMLQTQRPPSISAFSPSYHHHPYPPTSFSAASGKLSPSRRTSYPQLHSQMRSIPQQMHASSPFSGPGNQTKQYSYTQSQSVNSHPSVATSPPSMLNYSIANPPSSTSVRVASKQSANSSLVSVEQGDVEGTCRYALDILEQQVRKIDAQQETLNNLRDSTLEAITKVEQLMQSQKRQQ
ncbi:hypothetical protein GGI07_001539 [Coemansia sp. Benny D115]|nr:hypothetical protein GGI07_001539 [Coemansia sp. Benny D115]